MQAAFYLFAQVHLLNDDNLKHLQVPAANSNKAAYEAQAKEWARNWAHLATKSNDDFHGASFASLNKKINEDFQNIPAQQAKKAEEQPAAVVNNSKVEEPIASKEEVEAAIEETV